MSGHREFQQYTEKPDPERLCAPPTDDQSDNASVADRRQFLKRSAAVAMGGAAAYASPEVAVALSQRGLSPGFIQEFSIRSTEATIGYDIYGADDKAPTMLNVMCDSFDIVVPLAQTTPRTVMYLRGMVRSPADNETTAFTLANYMTDFEIVLSATVGGAPTNLLGYSHGGYWTTKYALANMALVSKLVLIEPALFTTTESLNERIELAEAGDGPGAAMLTVCEIAPASCDQLKLGQAIADNYQSAQVLAKYFTVRRDNPISPEDLTGLTIPVLLIKGDSSPAAVQAMVDTAHSQLPNSQLEVISGADHLTLQDGAHGAQIAELIAAFEGGS